MVVFRAVLAVSLGTGVRGTVAGRRGAEAGAEVGQAGPVYGSMSNGDSLGRTGDTHAPSRRRDTDCGPPLGSRSLLGPLPEDAFPWAPCIGCWCTCGPRTRCLQYVLAAARGRMIGGLLTFRAQLVVLVHNGLAVLDLALVCAGSQSGLAGGKGSHSRSRQYLRSLICLFGQPSAAHRSAPRFSSLGRVL